MRHLLMLLVAVFLLGESTLAQTDRFINPSDGSMESGWIISIPSGSSDFFNTRTSGASGTVVGIHASVSDFGTSATSFPRVGLYRSNLGLDASGLTPDLSSPITGGGPGGIIPGLGRHSTQIFPMQPAPAEAEMHTVIQLPPGDSGLLGLGADTDAEVFGGEECGARPNPFDSSGFSDNGYSSQAVAFAFGEFGMGPLVEGGTDGVPQLRLFSLDPMNQVNGDYSTLTTREGDTFGISFWGEAPQGIANSWMLFISGAGLPLTRVGGLLSSSPIGNGFSNRRILTTWPSGAGNLTLNFITIAGSFGVVGSVATSNEITLCSLPDSSLSFGTKDDGTYEGGWVVTIPTGSSDYLATPWGGAPGAVSHSRYAVMDFGTSMTSFPRSGQAPPNLNLDPAGNTPDLTSPYVDSTLSFPPLTFVTTSSRLVSRSFSPYTPSTEILEFIQFPVGDPGLLAIGGDSNSSFIDGRASWTLSAYRSPANLFGNGNWGMRIQ